MEEFKTKISYIVGGSSGICLATAKLLSDLVPRSSYFRVTNKNLLMQSLKLERFRNHVKKGNYHVTQK